MEKTSLAEAYDSFAEHWAPRLAGAVNDHSLKIAKIEGKFDWHHHAADELFMVRSGAVRIELETADDVNLRDGEFVVIPAGVEHRPVAEGETEIMLFEPTETKNTGDQKTERTAELETLDRTDHTL